jgi:hypothetical protein
MTPLAFNLQGNATHSDILNAIQQLVTHINLLNDKVEMLREKLNKNKKNKA